MKYNSDFRTDLEIGIVYEKQLGDMFDGAKIEVKRDFRATQTGNVFVEYRSRGKRSGISTTEADYYCFFLSERSMVIIATDLLKEVCRVYLNTSRDVRGGDENTSHGILLPLTALTRGY